MINSPNALLALSTQKASIISPQRHPQATDRWRDESLNKRTLATHLNEVHPAVPVKRAKIVKAIDLNDIRLLMQVIEHGSYTAASRAVGVAKSTISQRIATLERDLGTGLLRRTSRSFSLTEAGTLLLPHAREIEDLAKKIELALLEKNGELAGTLRVSCCNALAQHVVLPLVPRFLSQHPDTVVRVEATNRLVDLIGEGFDMAIRSHFGPLKDSSLLQRVVGRTPWSIITTPSWIERNQLPATPKDIPVKEVLGFSAAGREALIWTLRRDDVEVTVQIMPRLISDDTVSIKETALAGHGLACLPDYLVAGAVRRGQLIHVLPDWLPMPQVFSLLTPPKAQSSRLARAFSDFLAAEIPGALTKDS